LKERVLTGIGLLLLLSLIVYLHNFWIIWGFLGFLYLASIFEVKKLYRIPPRVREFQIAVAIWIVVLTMEHPSNLTLVIISVVLGLIAYKPEMDRVQLYPYIYPTVPLLVFFDIYINFTISALGWLVVVVALTDTMAYFVGRAIGKRSFSPTSPKKTLEGVFGGVLFGTVGGLILGDALFVDFGLFHLLILSLLTSVASVFGDLFESFLKRSAGVKDSGDLLPGHGGVLDRLDGYLLSAPVLLVLLQW
jgi:phosphatidate cytidylyltransferase